MAAAKRRPIVGVRTSSRTRERTGVDNDTSGVLTMEIARLACCYWHEGYNGSSCHVEARDEYCTRGRMRRPYNPVIRYHLRTPAGPDGQLFPI